MHKPIDCTGWTFLHYLAIKDNLIVIALMAILKSYRFSCKLYIYIYIYNNPYIILLDELIITLYIFICINDWIKVLILWNLFVLPKHQKEICYCWSQVLTQHVWLGIFLELQIFFCLVGRMTIPWDSHSPPILYQKIAIL